MSLTSVVATLHTTADIQGTASITLAGLLSAARATGKPLSEHRILFLGAGEAGTGIGELVAHYLQLRHGMSLEEGRGRCFYLDSKGLVSLVWCFRL